MNSTRRLLPAAAPEVVAPDGYIPPSGALSDKVARVQEYMDAGIISEARGYALLAGFVENLP